MASPAFLAPSPMASPAFLAPSFRVARPFLATSVTLLNTEASTSFVAWTKLMPPLSFPKSWRVTGGRGRGRALPWRKVEERRTWPPVTETSSIITFFPDFSFSLSFSGCFSFFSNSAEYFSTFARIVPMLDSPNPTS